MDRAAGALDKVLELIKHIYQQYFLETALIRKLRGADTEDGTKKRRRRRIRKKKSGEASSSQQAVEKEAALQEALSAEERRRLAILEEKSISDQKLDVLEKELGRLKMEIQELQKKPMSMAPPLASGAGPSRRGGPPPPPPPPPPGPPPPPPKMVKRPLILGRSGPSSLEQHQQNKRMSVADIIRTAGPIKLKKASDLQRSPGGTPIRQKKDSMEENEFFRVLKAKFKRVREESAGSPDSVDSVTPKTGSTGKSASRVLGGGIEDDKENSSPQQRVDALMKAMEDVSAVTAGKGGSDALEESAIPEAVPLRSW